MQDFIKESIADAKAIKKAAYENAKLALEEAFQPTLQRIVSSRIAEEGEEEMDDLDTPIAEPAPAPEAPVAPAAPAPAPEAPASDVTLPAPDMAPAPEAEDDLELESILRELEAEEGMMEMDDEEGMMEMDDEEGMMEMDGDFDPFDPDKDLPMEGVNEGDYSDEEGDDMNEIEEIDEDVLDRLVAEIENDGMGDAKDQDLKKAKNEGRRSARVSMRIRKENAKLRKELKEAYYAITVLKSSINEVRILNTKLRYVSALLRGYDLNENQQTKVLESFDKANTLKEAKMVFEILSENFKTFARKADGRSSRSKDQMVESIAPKTVKAKKLNENRAPFADKWQMLAGIKKLED